MVDFLNRLGSTFGSFPSSPNLLEEYQPSGEVFRNYNGINTIRSAIGADEKLLSVYSKLVETVVIPQLKALIVAAEGNSSKEHIFYYQYPPTLRLQSGPSKQHGRSHRDAEYGHQQGEINFWMPLTYYSKTQTTLFVEDVPESNIFHPLMVDYGSIGKFHGTS